MASRLVSRSCQSLALIAALSIPLLFESSLVLADDDTTVVHIEEDWELVITTPDPDSNGPQIVCVMSPYCHVNSVHATLELNHRTLPNYLAGGIQLQLWQGEEPFSHRKVPQDDVLKTQGETITWTQCMELNEGTLTFEIINGSSTTWGAFGGQGYLRDTSSVCTDNLNNYSPDLSVKHSGVGFAANRVQSLTLKRVRYETDAGVTIEDSTSRSVELSN